MKRKKSYKRRPKNRSEPEEKYRKLVDAALVGIYITQKHIVKFCNPRLAEIFGYKNRERLTGKHVRKLVAPTDWPLVRKEVRLREEGKKESAHYEFKAVRKDGTFFDAEVLGTRIIYDGKPAIQGMLMDVSSGKRAFESLQISERKYRSLIEGLPDIVWSFSTRRGTVYASSRVKSVLGYTPKYLYEHPWLWNKSIHPDDHARVSKVITDFIKGKDFAIEYRIKDAKGSWRWFLDRSVGRRKYKDEVIIEGISSDITLRKQLDDTIKRRDTILAAVSSVAGQFLRTRPWDRVVNNALKVIADAAGVCRAYVFENHFADDGTLLTSQRYEWTGPGCKPQVRNPIFQKTTYTKLGLGRWPKILSRGKVIHSPVRTLPASERKLLAAQGIKSIAIMPIFVNGKWWGFTGFNECRHERDWSTAEIEALKAWAEMLSSAIHRRQIEDKITKESAEQALLANIARVVGSSLNLPEILERLMDKTMTVCDCEHGMYYLIDRKSMQYTGMISRGIFHELMPELRSIRIDARELSHAINIQKPIILKDSQCCPILSSRLIKQEGMQTVLLIPLASGKTIQGALVLATPIKKTYDDRELNLFSAIGSHTGYAIEKARLYNAAQRELKERRSLEKELRQSETKYRTIFDTAPDIIVTLDLSGKVTSCSKAVRAITGFRVSDFVGHHYSKLALLSTEDIPKFTTMFSKACIGEIPAPFRIKWKTNTGEQRIVDVRVGILLKGKKINGIQIIARDVTDLKKAEEALKESEEHLKDAQKLGQIGNWEFDVDSQKITWSDETYRLYERDKDLGPPSVEEEALYYSSEESERLHEFARIVTEEGKELENDFKITLLSGRVANFHTKMQPIKDNEGRVVRVFGTVQDITDRKKTEESLKESEDKFRTIAEQSLMGIGILQDNVIKYLNKTMADLYGYTVEEVLNWKPMEFFKIFTPETIEFAAEQAEKKQRGAPGQLVNYIVHGVKKNGDLIWVDNFSRTISYEGRPADLVTQVDITGRIQNELLIKRRDAILEAVAFAAEQFLRANIWTDVIRDVLQRLGEAAEVSRTYLFQNHRGKNRALLTSLRYEWTTLNTTPQIDNPMLKNVSYRSAGFERWKRIMSKGKHILGHVREFQPKEKKMLAPQDIKSILTMPVFVGNEWWGFIGFDECRYEREWSTAAIEALKIAANAIGTVIQRTRVQEVLKYQADLLDDVSDAVISTDLKFRIISWNKAAEKMYGWKTQEVVGKPVAEVTNIEYPYDQRAEVVDKFLKEGFWNGEVIQRRRDGKEINVLTSVSLVKDSAEKPIGAVAVNRDITVRKRAAMELEREHTKLRKYLNISGVTIVALNVSGRVELINRKGCQILGLKEREIIGKDWFANFIPERFKNQVRTIFEKSIAGEYRQYVKFENPVLTSTGEERIIQWYNTVLKDSAGKVVATLSSGNDITEQKKTEVALTMSEEKYRGLVEDTNVGIISTDANGMLTYFNQAFCRMLGYRRNELIGKSLADLMHSEDQENTMRAILGRSRKARRASLEFRVIHKNGRTVNMLSNPAIIRERGKTIEVNAIIENITARKEAELVIRRHLQLENRLAKLSERLVKTKDIASALQEALADLADLFKVDRALLVQREEKTNLWRITHEWHEKGLTTVKEKLPIISEDDYSGWFSRLKKKRYISIIDTAQLPKSLIDTFSDVVNRRPKSIVAIPLYIERQLSGILWLTAVKQYTRWEKYDIEILQAAGDVMMASMFKDRYQTRLAHTLKDLDTERQNIVELAKKTIEIQERERLYFASEIHDNLLQSLVAVLYYLQMLEIPISSRKMSKRKERLVATIKSSIDSGRALIREIEPLHAPEISLIEAVKNSIETRFIGTSTRFDFVHPKRLPQLSFAAKINLLRIIQEALMNARKHAQASNLKVNLKVEKKKLLIDIRDDGVGFNPSVFSKRPAGQLGLMTMQERARLVGGELNITSEPDKGTRVWGIFPLGALRT